MSPLPQNQQIVASIKAELEPRILGTELPPWSCCCGSHSHARSRAVEVVPGGQGEHAGQETSWDMWSVKMRDLDSKRPQGDYDYGVGLSRFVDPRELASLFKERFGSTEA